jgi:hypothetical protein
MSDPTNNLSQIMEALQQLQLENEVLRNSLQELQARTSLPSQLDEPNLPPHSTLEPNLLPTPSPTCSHILEPKVSLPEKFDAKRSHFRGSSTRFFLSFDYNLNVMQMIFDKSAL